MSTKQVTEPALASPTGSLGVGRGAAMFIGSVLGPGVLALPRLAAAAAGPAAIIAWIALLALSVPVCFTFANLAARHPDAGGVSTFVRRAFGDKAAAVVGWWFFCVIPVGAPAAGFIGAAYVSEALGGGRGFTVAVAMVLIATALAANHLGLRMSGGVQMLLMALLITVLSIAIVIAVGHVSAANFVPFAPHGVTGILSAAGVMFFATAGGEAITHLSGEFRDPRRQLLRVTGLTLIVVTVIYLGLSIVSIGALGDSAATNAVPVTSLLRIGFGDLAAPLTAIIAVVLTLGAMNAFIAGASRLGAALARDGAMPAGLARGGGPGQIPHRSLALLAVMSAATTAATVVWNLDLDTLMRATSACLAAVTVLGTAAGVWLLRGRLLRLTALSATGFTFVVLVGLNWFLLIPAVIAALALAYTHSRR